MRKGHLKEPYSLIIITILTEIEFWLQDMETKLTTEELGHDITSVDSLLKKQQLQEADIKAHEVRTPSCIYI